MDLIGSKLIITSSVMECGCFVSFAFTNKFKNRMILNGLGQRDFFQDFGKGLKEVIKRRVNFVKNLKTFRDHDRQLAAPCVTAYMQPPPLS